MTQEQAIKDAQDACKGHTRQVDPTWLLTSVPPACALCGVRKSEYEVEMQSYASWGLHP